MTNQGTVSILIIEDEPDLREIMVEEFESRGWAVSQAETGPAAMELIRVKSFDIVISDIRMPGYGGVELVKRLALEHLAHPRPQFIFVTGFSDFTEDEVLAVGARAVLQKPFRLREMMKCVDEILFGADRGAKGA